MIKQLVDDKLAGISNSIISAKFHNTIIALIKDIVTRIKNKYNIKKVVLSGGTFQNRYLLTHVENKLINKKFEVYSHSKVPSNDGGIALGQLAIAAKMREIKCA